MGLGEFDSLDELTTKGTMESEGPEAWLLRSDAQAMCPLPPKQSGGT